MHMKVCYSALLALSLAFRVGEARESFPMRTLRCYNDYTSQVTCTWQECTAARRFLSLTLYHVDNQSSTQIPCEPQGPEALLGFQGSCVYWICRRNTTHFSLGMHDYYAFKPDQELQATLNVILFQTVSNSSHCLLKQDTLLPGNTYAALVRSKLSQGSGWSEQSSKWSIIPTWRFQEGDEAQPKNLRCMFVKADRLRCSWEVRREITSSVLFTLFYRATAASDEIECSPVQEVKLLHSPYLLQSCEINVTDPSEPRHYLITVHPKKEKKLIEAYKNIKPHAPVNVTVTKMEDQEYELRWIKQNLSYEHITQKYEFWYWKTGGTVEHINISNDKPPFIFTLQRLEPSTQYTGKMRARVHTSSSYQGPWSEWSEECTWETESVWSPLMLPLVVPIFTILLIAFAWCSYKGLLSKKKNWEKTIPNPGKSHLLQSYLQKAPLGILRPGSQLDFVELSPSKKMGLASCIQELDWHMKVSSAELLGAEAKKMVCVLHAPGTENPCQTLEVTASAPCPSAPADCHSSHVTSQSLSPATLPDRSSTEVTASLAPVSCFDFSGPYLYLPHTCSLPDIHQDHEAA